MKNGNLFSLVLLFLFFSLIAMKESSKCSRFDSVRARMMLMYSGYDFANQEALEKLIKNKDTAEQVKIEDFLCANKSFFNRGPAYNYSKGAFFNVYYHLKMAVLGNNIPAARAILNHFNSNTVLDSWERTNLLKTAINRSEEITKLLIQHGQISPNLLNFDVCFDEPGCAYFKAFFCTERKKDLVGKE